MAISVAYDCMTQPKDDKSGDKDWASSGFLITTWASDNDTLDLDDWKIKTYVADMKKIKEDA